MFDKPNFDQQTQAAPKMQITQDMVAKSPTLTCECGSIFFSEKILFKKLSPIISPSGREEMIPINCIICDKCEKVHPYFDPNNVIPEDLKSKIKPTITL